MIDSQYVETNLITQDPRFEKALELFNSSEWYLSHDVFEDLWHETLGPERNTLQAFLQIAVAQIHLERGNRNGSIILFGEALGRLTKSGNPNLGLDVEQLCESVRRKLESLYEEGDPELSSVLSLCKRELGTS